MHVACLRVGIFLHNCHSLKEKRRHLLPIKQRFGKVPYMAIAESDFNDQWQRAELSMVVLESSRQRAQSQADKVVATLRTDFDFELLGHEVEFL